VQRFRTHLKLTNLVTISLGIAAIAPSTFSRATFEKFGRSAPDPTDIAGVFGEEHVRTTLR
jgi:hypothetical protein